MQQDNNVGQSPEYVDGFTTADDLAQIIMPTENKYSIKSYYFGYMGFIPFIGLLFQECCSIGLPKITVGDPANLP
jgi:hypothetical protein